MKIQPTPSGPSGAAASRIREQQSVVSPRSDADTNDRPGLIAGDRVELSTTAHEIQGASLAGRASGSGLSSERMGQILERMQSGHYDKPAVRDAILGSLAGAIGVELPPA